MSNKRPNAVIVLQALLDGHLVKFGPHTFAASEDNEIGVVMTRYKDKESTGEEVRMLTEMTLNQFIKGTEKLSDDEIAGISADITLSAIQRSYRRRRG